VKQLPVQRALRFLACASVVFGIFEGCSSSDSGTLSIPLGPVDLHIAGISLGQGDVSSGGAASVLACDNTIDVTISLSNWLLRPPGYCTSSQCGQLRVTLLDPKDGAIIASKVATSVSVDLTLAKSFVRSLPGDYAISAELVTDGNVPFIATEGNSSDQQAFHIAAPADCTGQGSAGAGGEGGEGGEGGTSASAGAGNSAGTAGTAGTAGDSAGDSAGGAGGVPAAAGAAGA